MLCDVRLFHGVAQGRQVSCRFQTFDGRFALRRQPDVPRRKGSHDDAYYARDDGQHDEIDGQHIFDVRRGIHDFRPYPTSRDGEAVEPVDRSVYQEQQERLVVLQTYARGQPRAVVVHL